MSAWLILAIGLVAIAVYVLRLNQDRPEDAVLRRAALLLELDYRPGFAAALFSAKKYLLGAMGDFQIIVKLELPRTGERHGKATITVRGEDIIAPNLVMAPADLTTVVKRTLSEGGVSTGVPDFDRVILLRGTEAEVTGLLDYQTRKVVERAVAVNRVEVHGGAVTYSGPLDLTHADPLVERVRLMYELARRLDRRDLHLRTRLNRNARRDPDRRVRMNNLSQLQGRFPDTQETREASRAALADKRGSMRMLGASTLGAEGNAVAREILTSGKLELEVRRQALAHLCHHATADELRELFEEVWGSLEESLLILAVEKIGELEMRGVEPKMIALLEGSSAPILTATITTLGRVGSVLAVEPLRTFNRGLLGNPIKRTAAEAVDRIQSRLEDAGPGYISVLPEVEGQGALSLAREPGALSLTDPIGAVSLTAEDTPVTPSPFAGDLDPDQDS